MKTIAIFGYGSIGQKLAKLFSDAGHSILICSRDGHKGSDEYQTSDFKQGAQSADIIALALPYTAVGTLLQSISDQLTDKTIIDCTNPLNDDWSPLLLGQETSAGENIAAIAPQANIVKAFNTVFADVMSREHFSHYSHQSMTAFIAGDDSNSKQDVITLATEIGMEPVDTGPLMMSRYLEAMAHLNIQIAVGQGGGTGAAFYYCPANVLTASRPM